MLEVFLESSEMIRVSNARDFHRKGLNFQVMQFIDHTDLELDGVSSSLASYTTGFHKNFPFFCSLG